MLFNLLIFFSFHYIMVSTTALSPLSSKPVFDSFFPSSCGEINIILDCTFCNESIHYIMKRGPTAPKNETVADAWPVTVPEFKRLPTSVVTMLILCSFGTSIAFILGGLFANKVSSMWHSGSYDLPRLTDMEVE